MDRQILPGLHNQRTRITRAEHRAGKDDLGIGIKQAQLGEGKPIQSAMMIVTRIGEVGRIWGCGAGWPCRAHREDSAHIHISTWKSQKRS